MKVHCHQPYTWLLKTPRADQLSHLSKHLFSREPPSHNDPWSHARLVLPSYKHVLRLESLYRFGRFGAMTERRINCFSESVSFLIWYTSVLLFCFALYWKIKLLFLHLKRKISFISGWSFGYRKIVSFICFGVGDKLNFEKPMYRLTKRILCYLQYFTLKLYIK